MIKLLSLSEVYHSLLQGSAVFAISQFRS